MSDSPIYRSFVLRAITFAVIAPLMGWIADIFQSFYFLGIIVELLVY